MATARLQAVPDAAVPLLLEPGRVDSGPHDRWTASMLALAKIGEPAIPAITARVMTLLTASDSRAVGGVHPLVKVLGSMGPAAVPALMQIAEASTSPYVTVDALHEIVRLEPRTRVFGQSLSPWLFWRPADDRLEELRRQLVPQLPRVQRLMERAITEWKPERPAPQGNAAYLLARWGEGEVRARGLQVLEELAHADEPFYYNLESLRLLHALDAPETARLIRIVAAKVPETDTTSLRGLYLLQMATALDQLGDRDYASLLAVALRDARPDVRAQAAWFDTHRHVSRRTLVARRLEARLAVVHRTPIWDVNRWIGEFSAAAGEALFPLIDHYLARRDLDASAAGPNSHHMSTGGSGPIGMYGPDIVTLLLEMTLRRLPGALQRLTVCLNAADPQVRMFGALALSAFDRPRAIEQLAVEAKSPEAWHRERASEFLLHLGDKRGIPALLEMLESDHDAARRFACRDLRVYTQEPLPCEATASASDRAVNISAWQAWWKQAEPTFRVKSREAELDLAAFPSISPVSFRIQTHTQEP